MMMNKKEYAPEWQDVIRPQILKRDGYQCRHCRVNHRAKVYKNKSGKYVECDKFTEQWAVAHNYKVFTLYLQVAHLDHDKTNNDSINLLSLCPKCHAKFDAHHKSLMRKIYKANNNAKNGRIPIKYNEMTSQFIANIRTILYEQEGVDISPATASMLLDEFKSGGIHGYIE